LERNDIGASPVDCYLTPMRQVVEPFAKSRNDYDVFSGLAERLGGGRAFTAGRDEMAWVKHIYNETRANARKKGVDLPEFDNFWAGEQFTVEDQVPLRTFAIESFRRDPEQHRLRTPSGKIELYSETIGTFGYEDCGPHPMWYDKKEWLGSPRANDYPLHLISNQPKTRLHSQYDHGMTSRMAKIEGREVARMHPDDGAARGINEGDIVRVFNDRGACLAGVRLSPLIRPGVIELPTGAWYDPDESDSLEVHGNPNVLTRDVGTSRLAQGPTAHSCLVEVHKFDRPLPAIKAFSQPPTEESGDSA
jgi:biotin/methionine sulfoxide reductase